MDRWATLALDLAPAGSAERLELLRVAAFAKGAIGDVAACRSLSNLALDLCDELGDEEMRSRILSNLGTYLVRSGEHEQGVPMLEEAVEIVRRLGSDARALGVALYLLGRALGEMGSVENAEVVLLEARGVFSEAGMEYFAGLSTQALGEAALMRGDHHRSLQLSADALEELLAFDDPEALSIALVNIAQALGHLGQLEDAGLLLFTGWSVRARHEIPDDPVGAELSAVLEAQLERALGAERVEDLRERASRFDEREAAQFALRTVAEASRKR
jgi:tetratricopeptide (TPR) repeat protein